MDNMNPVPQPTGTPQQPAATPQLPATLSPEAATMLTQFKALDPNRQGVGLHQIRVFYPGIGWNVINRHVRELESAGILSSYNAFNAKGGVSHKVYTWKAV